MWCANADKVFVLGLLLQLKALSCVGVRKLGEKGLYERTPAARNSLEQLKVFSSDLSFTELIEIRSIGIVCVG